MSAAEDFVGGALTGCILATFLFVFFSIFVMECRPADMHQSLNAKCLQLCGGGREYHEASRTCSCPTGAVYRLSVGSRQLSPERRRP